MDLELATLTDIIKELERRKVRFLFIGVEPSTTRSEATTYVGVAAKNKRDFVHILRLACRILERRPLE